MKLFIVFVVIVVRVFAEHQSFTGKVHDGLVPMRQSRILGGTAVSIASFPWTLSMRHFGAHRCGGALISSTRALTAAHCTIAVGDTGFAVRAGSTQHDNGGQLITSERVINHPRFNLSTIDNDICVIWLSSAFDLSPAGVAAIQMHTVGAGIDAGTLVTVAGWGAICEDCEGPSGLRAVSLPVVANALCNAYHGGGIFPGMLCAGFASGGRDSCQGDSGGPLSMGNVLVGIVSRGRGCGRPNQPGVYARVAFYRTWIDQTI